LAQSKFNKDALVLQLLLKVQQLPELRVELEAIDLLGCLGAQQDTGVFNAGPLLVLHVGHSALLERTRLLDLVEHLMVSGGGWRYDLGRITLLRFVMASSSVRLCINSCIRWFDFISSV
jgi:hypothetical protein